MKTQESIAVLTTGGTIGSVLSSEAIGLDKTGSALRDLILDSGKARRFQTEVFPVLNMHSEDMRPTHWVAILQKVQDLIEDGYQSIVVTHGTDTLPYIAAAMALLFGRGKARICLTGAMQALEAPDSDAPLNLAAAVRTSKSADLPAGVYVAFRTVKGEKGNVARVIPALHLKPVAFDEVTFEGAYGQYAAHYVYRQSFQANSRYEDQSGPFLGGSVPRSDAVTDICRQILLLNAYPGLTLESIESSLPGLKAIVIAMYHSGTADSGGGPGGIREYLQRHSERLPVLFGAFPGRILDMPYESTLRLIRDGGLVYRDVQPHVLYAALVIGLAQGRSIKDVLAILAPWSYGASRISR